MVDISLRGVHVALATPVDESGAVDHDGLRRLVNRVIDGGVSAICTTGSTGEGPRLTQAQRREVLAAVREAVPADVPLVPAPAGQSPQEVLDELAGMAEAGADAVLVPVPSYFPMSEDEVAGYYDAVAAETPLPLLIYNFPAMTGVSVPPTVVARLSEHARVIGIKDSSRDLEYLQSVVFATSDATDFTVLTGTDTMLVASLAVGAHGAIAASANLVPDLSRMLYDAVRDEQWTRAQQLQRRLCDVVKTCRVGATPAGWKAGLEHAGVCSRRVVPPWHGLAEDAYSRLSARLKSLDVGGD